MFADDSREDLTQMVTSLVLSRLDYCNAVLAGLPASTLAPLQHAQKAAARLALWLDRRSHITTALQKLHWLPVKYRVTFKIATIMHQTFHRRCLSCLSDFIVFASADSNVYKPTSLLHYSSRYRQTKQDAVRKACLLSGRPRHMEQSSRHHP